MVPGSWASAAKVSVARGKKTVNEVSVPHWSLTDNLSPALGFWAWRPEEGAGGRGVTEIQSSDWFRLISSEESSRRGTTSSRLWILFADVDMLAPLSVSLWRSAKDRCLAPPLPGTPQHRPCLFPWCSP